MEIYYLKFNGAVNTSIQRGDVVWKAGNPIGVGVINENQISVTDNDDGDSTLVVIGRVRKIIDGGTEYTVHVEVSGNPTWGEGSAFYFFTKDNRANKSSVKGYYSKVRFLNNSKTKAELFATSFGVSQSSK